mmetsp:Transcript_4037/g.6226  ORF Transcript_4037/g.6226 Transcript_4037/m.6226 type:complete len:211 (+) Transcript_4037:3-635(+)
MAQAAGQQVFIDAVRHVFNSWTTLTLAVDQGWGGRESRQKALDLLEDVGQLLLQPKTQKKRWDDIVDVGWLSDYLEDRMLALFNVEIQDDSDDEVAAVLLRLLNTCSVGDFSYAQHVLTLRGASATQCTAREEVQYATEDEVEAAAIDDVELAPPCAGLLAHFDPSPTITPIPEASAGADEEMQSEPEQFDPDAPPEDGWQMVPKKKGRR